MKEVKCGSGNFTYLYSNTSNQSARFGWGQSNRASVCLNTDYPILDEILSYVHLCKQLHHMKIIFAVFACSYPVTSNQKFRLSFGAILIPPFDIEKMVSLDSTQGMLPIKH